MQAILDWGAGVIASVQTLRSPALDIIALAITQLGSEYFFLAVLPIMFWCVDERKAIRLGLATFFTLFVNIALKGLIALPRPYESRPGLHVIDEAGYSLPSWHAQGSATFWGLLAVLYRKKASLVLAFAMPLLIGFTRVYLGVHYPTDVLAGWAIGATVALGFWALEGKIVPLLAKLHARFQIALVAAAAWLMCFLHMEDVAPGAGFFGIGLGYALSRKNLRFSSAGSAVSRVLRAVLGGIVLGGLYLGLKAVFPGEGSPNYALFRFLRYGLMGFWVSFGAPWTFLKLKLAGRRPEEAVAARETARISENGD